jgi:hypothetical protein
LKQDKGEETISNKALLDEIDQLNLEQKAFKADDAEVPLYLWEEHLLEEIYDMSGNRKMLGRCG